VPGNVLINLVIQIVETQAPAEDFGVFYRSVEEKPVAGFVVRGLPCSIVIGVVQNLYGAIDQRVDREREDRDPFAQ
jgi:hypothetical protein